jgi:hypothetical protein
VGERRPWRRIIGLSIALSVLAAAPVALRAQGLGGAAAREKARVQARQKEAPARTFSDDQLPSSWTTWRSYTCPSCGFEVQFPAAPALSEDEVTSRSGTLSRRIFSAEREMKKYVVTVTTLTRAQTQHEDAEAIFDRAEQQACKDHDGRPYTRFAGFTDGMPSRTFSLQSEFKSEKAFLKLEGRMFLAGDKLYVLIQLVRNGAESVDLAPTFLDSFSLAPQPRPSAR